MTETVVEVSDAILCGAESIGSMGNEFGLVVQSFDGTVVDQRPKVIEDVLFMASHHPGELTNRGKPRMGGPPEPSFEVSFGPTGIGVVPEMAEQFREQVGTIDLEIQSFQFSKTIGLPLGEIPGVLQPDESRLVHQGLVCRPLLADFITSILVDNLHQMAHDVELVEDQHRLGYPFLDRVDVGLPYM